MALESSSVPSSKDKTPNKPLPPFLMVQRSHRPGTLLPINKFHVPSTGAQLSFPSFQPAFNDAFYFLPPFYFKPKTRVFFLCRSPWSWLCLEYNINFILVNSSPLFLLKWGQLQTPLGCRIDIAGVLFNLTNSSLCPNYLVCLHKTILDVHATVQLPFCSPAAALVTKIRFLGISVEFQTVPK